MTEAKYQAPINLQLRTAYMLSENMRKKPQGFSVEVRFNNQFRHLETFSLFGEGVGGALYIVAAINRLPGIAVVGILLVLFAILALLGHLGSPFRSWRAWANGSKSIASRGTIVMSAFMLTSVSWVFADVMKYSGVASFILLHLSILLAILVVLYAGFLLASIKGVRLWSSPYLALAFPAHSAATAIVILTLTGFLDDVGIDRASLSMYSIMALLFCTLMSSIHLMVVDRTRGGRASLNRIVKGDLRLLVASGVILFGILIPIFALWHMRNANIDDVSVTQLILIAVAVVGRLIGDYAYRRVIVRAGAYESILA